MSITQQQLKEIKKVINDPLYFYNSYYKIKDEPLLTLEEFNEACNILIVDEIKELMQVKQ